MERTEVDRSSNLEPGGRFLSGSRRGTQTGIEPFGVWGLQDREREREEAVAGRG